MLFQQRLTLQPPLDGEHRISLKTLSGAWNLVTLDTRAGVVVLRRQAMLGRRVYRPRGSGSAPRLGPGCQGGAGSGVRPRHGLSP